MNKETIKAYANLVWLVLSVISSVLVMRGYDALPVTEAQILTLASGISTVWATWSNWWKNNNVTAAAQEAQKVLDGIKEGKAE